MSEYDIKNLEELLASHLHREIVDKKITRLTAPGENYGSLMLKVDLTVKNGDRTEEIHAAAKCVPPNEAIQKMFNTQVTFRNEIAWYTIIIPTIQRFLRENNVRFSANFFTELYGARISLNKDSATVDEDGVILFENLTKSGYRNDDRHIGFDLSTAREVLKAFAVFHAVPAAMRLKQPELFDNNIRPHLHTVEFFNKEEFPLSLGFLKFLETDAVVKHLAEKVKTAIDRCKPFGTDDVQDIWGTTTHNDSWINNIMVRDKSEPKVKIVDLQAVSLGSPAADLVFCLITSVNTAVLEKHFDELIQFYYDQFIYVIKEVGVDYQQFPYDSFARELNAHGPAQFAHCVNFLCGILADKGDTQNDPVKKDYNLEEHMKALGEIFTERHQERFRFLIKEFARRNWI
ncbi:uncharacterized protein LOC132704829 [Cylas formicarius]|uniref:uncharacterized protein LOC132704829 n=1 Tax=Cylas formicarius TaxID=197179 RepID=UPI002958AFA5|nr:uncharacterized protein LOC132704829 [Cylas formicarius]XP_060531087.1 uncharacterized protein LOC132704829 [Cylas formicarius]